ncbi:MAG: hypothetical protein K0S12_1858, partial [Bacteroidetes bacterium]|nr:hypothetical protein [Bacteroidota bacterium]
FVFAFSLALNSVHNHPQFTFRFCIPLFFLFLHLYLQEQKLRSLLLCCLYLSFQFYLGIYLGYFTLFFGVVYFICYSVIHSKSFNAVVLKKMALHFFISGGATLLVLLPMFYMYYQRNKITGYYTDFSQILETIPEPSSYLKAFDGSLLWKPLIATPVLSKYSWFHTLFPGILVLGALLFSFFLLGKGFKKHAVLTLLVLTAVILLLTTNFNGNTFYDNLFHIPGFKAIRVVSRLILVFIFFLAWIVCVNIDYLESRSRKAVLISMIALPVLLFFDNYCRASAFKTFGKEETAQRTARIKSKIVASPGYKNYEAFAYIPAPGEETYKTQIDAMLTSVELQMKTINGYSSSCHGKFGPVWNNHDSVSVVTWAREMNLDPSKVLLVK